MTLIVVILFISSVYVDMNNATNAAVQEIRKMKELRIQILQER